MGTAEVVRTHAAQDTHCGRLAAASTPQNRSILYPKLCHFLLHFRFPSLYFPLLHIVWIEVDLKKNLAKELAGPKVVNDDLKFLTKEMGIFEREERRGLTVLKNFTKHLQHDYPWKYSTIKGRYLLFTLYEPIIWVLSLT